MGGESGGGAWRRQAARAVRKPGPPREASLTRELVKAAFPHPVADDETAMRLLPEGDIAASLARTLADRRVGAHGLWLFAYGSLVWKPDIDFAEQRVAMIRGWHRRFCLWQWRYRGTREQPGLMLALDRGGACKGIAYRIPPRDMEQRLAGIWRREMVANGYRPRWIRAASAEGPMDAVVFVANHASERYAGRLAEDVVADHIARACGHIGPSAEYLAETVLRCEELGIHDRGLWRLQHLVAERLRRR